MLKAILLLSFTNISSFVFITASTSFVLEFCLHTSIDERATLLGYLETADQVVSLVGCPFWSQFSSKVGEKLTCLLGLILMAAGLIIHPTATCVMPNNIVSTFRSLLLFRMIFSMGAAGSVTMLTSFSSSDALNMLPTKISSLLGVSSGTGALFSAFILNRIPSILAKYLSISLSLWFAFILMVLMIAISCISVMLLLPNRCMSDKDHIDNSVKGNTCPEALVTLLSSAVARVNTVSPHVFTPLWITSFCRAYEMEGTTFSASKKISSSLLGVCQLSAFLLAPIFGIYGGQLNLHLSNILCLLTAAISYMCLYMIHEPGSIFSYIVMIFIGIVEIASVIMSFSMFINSFGPRRGKGAGIYCLFGSLGIIYISNIGGILSDKWGRKVPYLLIGYTNLLFAIICIVSRHFREEREIYDFKPL